jgi:hypothetical protein
MRRLVLATILCFLAGLGSASSASALSDCPTDLKIQPDVLKVNTFFSGGQVTVTGEIPASDNVVVEVVGSRSNSLFDVKGRIGPFWMTRDKVDLENAPSLYVLMLPSGEDWVKKAAALGLGIENLRGQILVDESETVSEDLFQMFVKMKHSEGLYGEVPGSVVYSPGPNGLKRFAASCRLPSSIKVGRYLVKATSVAGGVRAAERSRELVVQREGFVKLVGDVASNRGLLYGIAAVMIALSAGAIMGLIFKGGGGH